MKPSPQSDLRLLRAVRNHDVEELAPTVEALKLLVTQQDAAYRRKLEQLEAVQRVQAEQHKIITSLRRELEAAQSRTSAAQRREILARG